MGLAIVTAPVIEPITLAGAKTHLRLTGSSVFDDELRIIKSSVRRSLEDITNTRMVEVTYDWTLDDFPSGRSSFRLPLSPVISITSLIYRPRDDSGNVTVATTVYDVDTTDLVTRLYLKPDQIWPTASLFSRAAVIIRFLVGYSAKLSDITTDANTNDTVLISTAAHGLAVGDIVRNTTLDGSPVARVVAVNSTTEATVEPITAMVTGQTVEVYQTSRINPNLYLAYLLSLTEVWRNRQSEYINSVSGAVSYANTRRKEALIRRAKVYV